MIADFKKKQKGGPFHHFLLIWGGLLTLLLCAFLVVADVRVYKKKMELVSQIENLKSKIEDIKNKNNDLKQDILKTNDDNYIEKVAREQLDLQKPGEKVVSFVASQNQQPQNRESPPNFFQAWINGAWNWIKSRL